jgi:pimeloyl-ACP methyl ester carboxylesterase
MTQPSERTVELRGGQFKTRVLSAGAGEPVVFLHGAGGLFWDPFLDRLAQRFTVVAPEHPGAGESQGLEHLDDLWDLVLYYDDLFEELGLASARVVGHSFGGMVAAELAANIGLWLDDHPIPDIAGIPPEKMVELVLADPNGPLAALMVPPADNPEALFRGAMTMASILHFIWPIPDKGLDKRIHRIKAPTLLVWGNQDRLVEPAYGEEFARRIAGARLVRVDGAGHLPQLEQTEPVAAAVTDFLT